MLFAHHDLTYVVASKPVPLRVATSVPHDRDIRPYPTTDPVPSSARSVRSSPSANHDRKKPFDIRSVRRAVADQDLPPLERWRDMAEAGNAVVFDAQLGGRPIALLGIESRPLERRGPVPGARRRTRALSAGTLFPRSSKKLARGINAASGRRPLVVLANLSGFDGSPESLRERQVEYGAEIGGAVVDFQGPIVFCVVSRYHSGGAFVVFSETLNDSMQVIAAEGARASVIGGAAAAAVVFSGEVIARTARDHRVVGVRERLDGAGEHDLVALHVELDATHHAVRAEMLGGVAAEFDRVHDIHRAVERGLVEFGGRDPAEPGEGMSLVHPTV